MQLLKTVAKFARARAKYVGKGAAAHAGFLPVSGSKNVFELGPTGLDFSGAGGWIPSMTPWRDVSSKTAARAGGQALFGLGMGAMFIQQGYEENGVVGAAGNLATDVAIMSGAMSAIGAAATPMGGGMQMARTMGAAVGAGVGRSVAGVPGAMVGAYIGARPLAMAASHPLLALGAGAAVGGYYAAKTAVYGTSQLLKYGRQHRRAQRGIDTSGSLSAFMTQGAQTMRGRAVQAIARSHLNARSALGQEASLLSFPSRGYHSNFKRHY